jgi:hypothetical protein
MIASFRFKNLNNLIAPTEMITLSILFKIKLSAKEGIIPNNITINAETETLRISQILIDLNTFFLKF